MIKDLFTKHKIVTVIVAIIAVVGFSAANTYKEAINEDGLNMHEHCMAKANDSFMQYLEDNSTTYKFDDGTVINLPHYDGVIDEAKQVLKAQEQGC